MPTSRRSISYRLSCAIFLTPIVFVGLIFLILWLSLRPHNPRFHIQEFSLQGLSQTYGLEKADIAFNVTVRNPNRRVSIYYESMRGSVYYKDQRIGVIPVLDSYHQEPKTTTILSHALSGSSTMPNWNHQRWIQFLNDRTRGFVRFRLKFNAVMQYKSSMWDKQTHRMRATCIVVVGPDGMLLPSLKDSKCHVHLS